MNSKRIIEKRTDKHVGFFKINEDELGKFTGTYKIDTTAYNSRAKDSPSGTIPSHIEDTIPRGGGVETVEEILTEFNKKHGAKYDLVD